MQHKNIFSMMVAVGIVLVVATGFWLATAAPASAQCGSQASSCKNCHEVQGEMPVNNDGTAWHQSHAFGDFCYICHAGNNQAKEEATAHTGMVPPLSDVKASCMQCHPDDLQERAQLYATALGVEIGSGASSPAAELTAVGADTASSAVVAEMPTSIELDVDDPNLINYAARYDEIVLGKKAFNWGNAILIGLIGLVGIGGGGLVLTREKLVKVSFGDTKKAEGEYPVELVDLLPALASLPSTSRKSLRKILDNPKKAAQILGLMDAVISDEKSEA